jgi:hypothetical protein
MLQASEYSLNLFFLKQKYIANEDAEINESLNRPVLMLPVIIPIAVCSF